MGAVDLGGAKKKKGGGRRPSKRVKIRIDMTPMVDVAFLLLIFFMVTTVFRRPQALEITIPSEKAEAEVPEMNVFQIRVNDAGKTFWNIGLEDPQAIETTELHTVVAQYRQDNPALAAVIKIDRKAPYHLMVDVLDEVTIGNLNRYSLAPFTEEDAFAITGGEGEGGTS